MTRVGGSVAGAVPGAILAFSCVRDELLRLPWFLDYHRRLGVDRFYFVDNDSRDGTTGFLEAQPDVTVFLARGSYAASQCGLSWINALLARYGCGHWTLTLDADELLVYPGCERVDLPRLTGLLHSAGADALQTMLLDLYSDRPIKETTYVPGRPFLEACPYFDANTYLWESSSSVPVRGGPRERVFWRDRDVGHPAPFLPKVPLVKWRQGLVYEASTHLLAGVTCSDVTGVLQHFKFFRDFCDRVAIEAARKEHFEGGRQYVTYADVMRENPGLSLFHKGAVRYRDSLQLVDVGLAQMPDWYRSSLAAAGTWGTSW